MGKTTSSDATPMNGNTAIWLMNETILAASGFPGGLHLTWQVEGMGDVNGNGKADIIWRNSTSGPVAVWLMNGGTVTAVGFPGSAPTDWGIQAVRDVNGDSKADLVWRNTNDGKHRDIVDEWNDHCRLRLSGWGALNMADCGGAM